jgi:hypothetical protein
MSGVFPVKPQWRAALAAITHVDGTARLQALPREMAPRLTTCSSPTGSEAAFRCCSTPPSTWPASRS